MTTTITVFLLLSMTAAVVVGYPEGPPVGHENLCKTMVPGHGESEAVGDAPFTLTATKVDNTTYTVLLAGTSSNQSVYGFFIQARPWDTSSSSESTDSVGTFASSASGTQLLSCFRKSNNAWGHSNADPKDNVTATWTAPSGSGDVRFRASVVLADFKQYWVELYSDVADYNATDVSLSPGLRFSVMALLVSLLLSFLATTRM